jgi:hypothetical protein
LFLKPCLFFKKSNSPSQTSSKYLWNLFIIGRKLLRLLYTF